MNNQILQSRIRVKYEQVKDPVIRAKVFADIRQMFYKKAGVDAEDVIIQRKKNDYEQSYIFIATIVNRPETIVVP